MTWHNVLAEWSQWFWPLAINHLWQATLFALLVWATMLLLRRASPLARHAAWSLAMLKFLLPAILLAWAFAKLGWQFSRAETVATEFSIDALILLETVEPSAVTTSTTTHKELYCLLTLVWLAGAMAVFLRWQMRRWRLARQLKTDSAEAAGRALEIFARLKQELGFSSRIPLIVSAKIAEPGLLGILRPKIVLPLGLIERLNNEELSAVLAHELIHIKQRDNLLSTIQMIVCCLLWFHPLIWLIDRKLLSERELMCDEKVLRFGGTAESYAAGLWKVVQHGLGWPVAGVSRVTGSNLNRRIKLMLNTKHQIQRSTVSRLATGAICGGLFITAIVGSWLAGGNAQAAKLPMPPELQSALAPALSPESAAKLFAKVVSTPTPKSGKELNSKTSTAQDAVTFDVPFENAPEFPLLITQAKMTVGGRVQSNSASHVSESKRELTLEARLLNQGDRPIAEIAFNYTNVALWGNRKAALFSKAEVSADNPRTLILRSTFPVAERSNGLELADHLSAFRLYLVGVQFEGETAMDWVEEDANKNRKLIKLTRQWTAPDKLVLSFSRNESQQDTQNQNQSAQPVNAESHPIVITQPRPKITYFARAKYTKEARDQKVEGSVELSLEFGADGVIRDIRVERGLPYGLTEAAIEAAKTVQFKPAMKDGQPISVRGKLQFSFSLYEKSN